MRAIDLFCGAGGASEGLRRAGFEVTGVDINPQPHFRSGIFVQADALKYDLSGFDLIWASPPCQKYTQLRGLGKAKSSDQDLIPTVREILKQSGIPYIIENVVGSPLLDPTVLCGSMFNLAVQRHRLFETSFVVSEVPPHGCRKRKNIAVYGKSPGHRLPDGVQRAKDVVHGQWAMGIDWMPWKELTQAIPPAYSQFLATKFLSL